MNVRIVGAVLAASLAIVACGGDDDDSSPPAATDAQPPAATDGTSDETGPTIAPDVPEEFLPGIGPVAIEGDPLPVLVEPDPGEGVEAPVLVGETLEGEPIRVDASVDGPTWMVFVAHWCPHCNDEIPVINQLRDDGLIPDDLNVVAVSTAANPGRPNFPPDEWLDDMDWTYPAVLDGVDVATETWISADAYGLTGFPFSVLIDDDGTVVRRWSGQSEPDELLELITI